MMADELDEGLLARNMIDVHGTQAAVIARGNARGAALAGQAAQARSWIRVLGIIQRRRIDKRSPCRGPGSPLPVISETKSTAGQRR
jgi:hypothetical protein